ncbi:MAG: rhodanese-like domain-containing protein [Clostridiaceae bacterium]|nr:rhodanese-like domain-containing protein [Clostridiaceae bacterium]
MFMFGRSKGKTVPVNELDALIGKIELIDIRETYEFSGGSLRTAKNVPMQKLISDPAKYLKKDKTYYLMCQSGARSRMCCGQLTRDGYDVVDVVGGYGMYFGSNRK